MKNKEFISKLNNIFVTEDVGYSYSDHKEDKQPTSEFEKAFMDKAKEYIDDMKPIYRTANEHTIRQKLIEIEQEIYKELKSDERFEGLKLPEHWANKVRIATGGYDLDVKKIY